MKLLNDLRASRRALAGFVVIGFGWASFSAQVPVIKGAVGLSDGAWGTLVLISAVGAILAMWLAPLAHRALGRWSMIAGAATMVAGFLVAGAAGGAFFVGLGLFLAAAGSGVSDVFANAEVSEAEADYGHSLMNLNHGLFSLAYALAAGVVGIAREAGLGPVAIFAGMAVSVAAFVPFMILPNRTETEEEAQAALTGMPRALVWVGGLVVLAAFLGEAASEGWSALHVERTLGGGPGEGALGPAILAMGMAVGRLGGHVFGARWAPMRVMIAASALAGVGLVLAGFASSIPVAYAGFALGGLGVSVVGPLALGLVGACVPRRLRLTAIAQAAGLGYAAFFLGPVLMGYVAEATSLRVSFYTIGAIMVAVAALLVPLWARMLAARSAPVTG